MAHLSHFWGFGGSQWGGGNKGLTKIEKKVSLGAEGDRVRIRVLKISLS